MPAKKPKTAKKKGAAVPADIVEAAQYVGKIKELELEIEIIEFDANQEIKELETKIAAIKKKAHEEAQPLQKTQNDLAFCVYQFADANRDVLLEKLKVKTVELETGDKIRWYLTRPAVQVEDEDRAVKELESKGLHYLIRTKKEVNREALLAVPDVAKRLKLLAITQDEIFAIVLNQIGIELQKGQRKFKKVKV